MSSYSIDSKDPIVTSYNSEGQPCKVSCTVTFTRSNGESIKQFYEIDLDELPRQLKQANERKEELADTLQSAKKKLDLLITSKESKEIKAAKKIQAESEIEACQIEITELDQDIKDIHEKVNNTPTFIHSVLSKVAADYEIATPGKGIDLKLTPEGQIKL